MCVTTTQYRCGHLKHEEKLCKEYRDRWAKYEKSTSKCRVWKFFCAPPKRPPGRCDAHPGHNMLYQNCDACNAVELQTWKETERLERERANERWEREGEEIAAAWASHDHAETERLEKKQFFQTKRTYRCSACTARGRKPDDFTRKVNSGLCCASAVEEYETWKRSHPGYRKPSRALSQVVNADTCRAVNVSSRAKSLPALNMSTSLERIRSEADRAAKSYGWPRDLRASVELEPELAASFVQLSGNFQGSLPPLAPPPKEIYYVPGIDWPQWDRHPRTRHGRYPVPGRAPNKPLPCRPLANSMGSSIPSEPGLLTESIAYEAEIVQAPPHDPMRQRMASSRGPVIPASHAYGLMDSASSSFPSPQSSYVTPHRPMNSLDSSDPPRLRSVTPNLNLEIDRAIHDWEGVSSYSVEEREDLEDISNN